MFDGATLANVGQIAAQHQSMFLGCERVGEPLSGRTDVNVLFRHVAEVLFAEAFWV
jgi:hypothetical protein